ncbi:M16 family metallopeptidase [Clostridium sp. MT-14]|jgi:predicted Zn-dependent peptidase|uniref:Insulinase family protein n=1 Tax=Clostridium aromativorans TaxID=2836848 RepID=A0ABS8N481_9CLOT|nr:MULTISPECIES: pitrilysin family protein [Clostridium]KAA8675015.1 insulinase family protein [Clostridium sp. HV4-5-A1G]MCC9294608.1 insulinase family protein [Clostridium aromativorans]
MYNLFKLDNGLRVVVENIDYVNSVSVGLWIKSGSRNEEKYNNGISHFIEHMLFKGTANRTALEIAESIEDVGGQINAFTGKEATCFYVKVLDTHLDLAIDVLADMLFNSKFLPEDIEKEKGVIVEEINMSEDLPEDVLSDLHNKAMWGNDSISLPILGNADTVKSFNRKQLLEYINSRYIPENSVISIAGKVNLKNVEKLIEKYFKNWCGKDKVITNYSFPKLLNNHLLKRKNIEQLHLSLGIQGVKGGSDDIYPLLLLNNIYGGGASSILFQKIREEKGLCYSVYSYLTSFNNNGVVIVYTGLNAKYVYDVICRIKEELELFSKNGIKPGKLKKSKEQLKGNYILGMESISSRMFNNGKSLLFTNKLNTPEDIIEKINNIDEDILNRVMKNTFCNGIVNSAFVGDNIDMEIVKNLLDKDIKPFQGSKSSFL